MLLDCPENGSMTMPPAAIEHSLDDILSNTIKLKITEWKLDMLTDNDST